MANLNNRYGKDSAFAQKAYEASIKSFLNHGTTTASHYATIDSDSSLILAEIAEKYGKSTIARMLIYPNIFELNINIF